MKVMTQMDGALPPLEIHPSAGSSERDFDFLHGAWTLHNRKLRTRLTGCDEWTEFTSRNECRPLLQGFANQDRFTATVNDAPFEALTLRLFDPEARLWSIYWADSNVVVMDTPQVGSFDGPIGIFLARDVWHGTPVTVQFKWDKTDPEHPRWSQAFSTDEGETWEWNWHMMFSRES
jgi:hypothetical protein